MNYQFTSAKTVMQFAKNRSEYDEAFLLSVLHSMQFVDKTSEKV